MVQDVLVWPDTRWSLLLFVFRLCLKLTLKAIVTTRWPCCWAHTRSPPQLWSQTFTTDLTCGTSMFIYRSGEEPRPPSVPFSSCIRCRLWLASRQVRNKEPAHLSFDLQNMAMMFLFYLWWSKQKISFKNNSWSSDWICMSYQIFQ